MKTYKEIDKLASIVSANKISCKCGKRIGKHMFRKKDTVICSWCLDYVFKDKQTEFRYKFKRSKIEKEKKGEY